MIIVALQRINRIPFRSMKVFRHNSRTELRPAEIHLLLRNFKYLESLDVSHNIELTSDSLSMLRKLVRLENLNLSNCKSVDHRVVCHRALGRELSLC
jgi:ABC-type lipoprotein export system ATPase subunit